jgi:CheY-like chemotaxis protein
MRSVFVIDDDHLMREVLSRVLEKGGFRVRAFQSPLHALPLMDSAYPDAIVSDVQMPGMNGVDLAREVRKRGMPVPVILVTASPSADVEERARELVVSDVFQKPIRDPGQLVAAVDLAVTRREDDERKAGLDRLRMSFLAGLAHELRTPLTAMKLAIDNLFAVQAAVSPAGGLAPAADGLRTAEGRLLAISQRNLDRIIRLVEGQLDLLQITLGDVSVARRLVSIRDLIERAVADTLPAVRKRVEIETRSERDRIFVFTDPDRLRAVIRHLLETGSCDESRPLRLECGVVNDARTVELRLRNLRGRADEAGDTFESRAFHRIVASLCGEIRQSGPGEEAGVTLRFPVAPRFDAKEDFSAPFTGLREAAMLSGRTVSVLRCDLGQPARNGSPFSPGEREFFQRAAAVLSEGDALIRTRSDGVYHLVLVERDHDEIARAADFLGGRADGARDAGVEVEIEEPVPDAPVEERGGTGIRAVVEEAQPVR